MTHSFQNDGEELYKYRPEHEAHVLTHRLRICRDSNPEIAAAGRLGWGIGGKWPSLQQRKKLVLITADGASAVREAAHSRLQNNLER